MRATCFLSAVNIYASHISLLLGDRWLLIVFLSEVGNFCYCILKVCKKNVPSLAWIQIVCFQLNSDGKSVTCAEKALVKERWRIQEVSES